MSYWCFIYRPCLSLLLPFIFVFMQWQHDETLSVFSLKFYFPSLRFVAELHYLLQAWSIYFKILIWKHEYLCVFSLFFFFINVSILSSLPVFLSLYFFPLYHSLFIYITSSIFQKNYANAVNIFHLIVMFVIW